MANHSKSEHVLISSPYCIPCFFDSFESMQLKSVEESVVFKSIWFILGDVFFIVDFMGAGAVKWWNKQWFHCRKWQFLIAYIVYKWLSWFQKLIIANFLYIQMVFWYIPMQDMPISKKNYLWHNMSEPSEIA